MDNANTITDMAKVEFNLEDTIPWLIHSPPILSGLTPIWHLPSYSRHWMLDPAVIWDLGKHWGCNELENEDLRSLMIPD